MWSQFYCLINVYTDQPKMPSKGTGSKVHLKSMKTMVILDWSPPENYDRTTIDYYELTLIGKDTKPNTTRVYVGAQADPRQSLSHMYIQQVDSDRNYTLANISAVDECGQRSEPLQLALTPYDTSNVLDLTPTKCAILASILGALALIMLS